MEETLKKPLSYRYHAGKGNTQRANTQKASRKEPARKKATRKEASRKKRTRKKASQNGHHVRSLVTIQAWILNSII